MGIFYSLQLRNLLSFFRNFWKSLFFKLVILVIGFILLGCNEEGKAEKIISPIILIDVKNGDKFTEFSASQLEIQFFDIRIRIETS